jgi:hypothetical protein
MSTINENGQTCLETRGITERNNEIVRSDYNINDQYSVTHSDALSNGDPQGKGTGHGGHTFWLPDCTKPTNMIDYSNFDTFNGGGSYDIDGRNGIGGRTRALASELYNSENQYSAQLVNTAENVAQGQYVVGQTTKHL